jgi:phenylpropionate dioxygenase-like ring-hydroxylating dioxygenase large terminal subunit
MSDHSTLGLPDVALTPHLEDILARLDSSVAAYDQAISLPPEVYTSEEWFEFEKRAVWDHEWICLGHQGLIPKPGDYVSITVNDDPLLVLRDKDGTVRVMSAVCQHRGYRLGEARGNAAAFTCPFHGWSYDLKGQLLGAPEMSEHVPMEELRRTHCLPRLRTEIWNGFVFINMDGKAKPLAPRLKRLGKEIENHHLADMGAVPTVDWGPSPWNWKFMHENAIEPQHTWYLHKGPHDFAPSRLASFADWDETDDGAVYHPTGFLELDGNFNASFRCLFPVIPTLTEKERKRVMFACILPNLFFGTVPDGCFYYCILPQGANAMTIRVGFVYPWSTLQMETFDTIFKATVDGLSIYNDADTVANTRVHQGLRSRFANRCRFGPKEKTLPQMNRWLIKRYKAYADELRGKRKRVAA